jgi:hypothetical protein
MLIIPQLSRTLQKGIKAEFRSSLTFPVFQGAVFHRITSRLGVPWLQPCQNEASGQRIPRNKNAHSKVDHSSGGIDNPINCLGGGYSHPTPKWMSGGIASINRPYTYGMVNREAPGRRPLGSVHHSILEAPIGCHVIPTKASRRSVVGSLCVQDAGASGTTINCGPDKATVNLPTAPNSFYPFQA